MKGLDLLITGLSIIECPSYHGLKDFKRESETNHGCKYGDGLSPSTCQECFKLAFEADYPEEVEKPEKPTFVFENSTMLPQSVVEEVIDAVKKLPPLSEVIKKAGC